MAFKRLKNGFVNYIATLNVLQAWRPADITFQKVTLRQRLPNWIIKLATKYFKTGEIKHIESTRLKRSWKRCIVNFKLFKRFGSCSSIRKRQIKRILFKSTLFTQTQSVLKMDDKTHHMFELPQHVDLSFDSTLSEPTFFADGACGKVFKPISGCLAKTYEGIQVVIYYILVVTVGVLLSLWWGVIFGIVNFLTVWVAHPFIKMFLTIARCFYACSRACTRMSMDPCFEAAAIAYTRIRGGIHVTLEKKGVEIERKSMMEEINVI